MSNYNQTNYLLKIGDRVQLVEKNGSNTIMDNGNNTLNNMKGKIVDIDKKGYLVEFFDDIHGHEGWYKNSDKLPSNFNKTNNCSYIAREHLIKLNRNNINKLINKYIDTKE